VKRRAAAAEILVDGLKDFIAILGSGAGLGFRKKQLVTVHVSGQKRQ